MSCSTVEGNFYHLIAFSRAWIRNPNFQLECLSGKLWQWKINQLMFLLRYLWSGCKTISRHENLLERLCCSRFLCISRGVLKLKCAMKNVIVLCLPRHTVHYLPSVDSSLFQITINVLPSGLTILNTDKWERENITHLHFDKPLCSAWSGAASTATGAVGFCATVKKRSAVPHRASRWAWRTIYKHSAVQACLFKRW